jgi:uncharacterized protein YktB (UPF0637 family)
MPKRPGMMTMSFFVHIVDQERPQRASNIPTARKIAIEPVSERCYRKETPFDVPIW